MDFFRTISKAYEGQIRKILLFFVSPSKTTTERDAIVTPYAGMIIFNTTTNKLNMYNGTSWEAITSA